MKNEVAFETEVYVCVRDMNQFNLKPSVTERVCLVVTL
jgi:hypothetical protein